jgi:hypothetical protein
MDVDAKLILGVLLLVALVYFLVTSLAPQTHVTVAREVVPRVVNPGRWWGPGRWGPGRHRQWRPHPHHFIPAHIVP